MCPVVRFAFYIRFSYAIKSVGTFRTKRNASRRPKAFPLASRSNFFFKGEGETITRARSKIASNLRSKLFETCFKIDLKIRPKVGRLAVSSFHHRSMGKARRGISTTRIFHLLNLKRRVCILFRVYIIIVAWKMFANISRNETSNEQRIRTNLKLMRGNRSIGATTVSTDRLTIRSSFHYFAYFSFGR